jgi:hypothetical protein
LNLIVGSAAAANGSSSATAKQLDDFTVGESVLDNHHVASTHPPQDADVALPVGIRLVYDPAEFGASFLRQRDSEPLVG